MEGYICNQQELGIKARPFRSLYKKQSFKE